MGFLQYAAQYKPYHLIGLELGFSVASIMCRGEPTGQTKTWAGDVVATAKRDLKAGEKLDGEGGYMCYGKLMPAEASMKIEGLPIGLAHGLVLKRGSIERPERRRMGCTIAAWVKRERGARSALLIDTFGKLAHLGLRCLQRPSIDEEILGYRLGSLLSPRRSSTHLRRGHWPRARSLGQLGPPRSHLTCRRTSR